MREAPATQGLRKASGRSVGALLRRRQAIDQAGRGVTLERLLELVRLDPLGLGDRVDEAGSGAVVLLDLLQDAVKAEELGVGDALEALIRHAVGEEVLGGEGLDGLYELLLVAEALFDDGERGLGHDLTVGFFVSRDRGLRVKAAVESSGEPGAALEGARYVAWGSMGAQAVKHHAMRIDIAHGTWVTSRPPPRNRADMADEPKKPRKVKDLKARLGRTIAPNTVKGGGSGDIAPPPNMGGGVVPPPANVGGLADVLGKVKPKVEAPPMVQAQQAREAEEEERRKKQAANPFAAGEAADGPQQVRIVVDGDPVEDSEVGRKRAGKIAAMAVAFIAVGAALGATVSGVMRTTEEHDAAIADAQTILTAAEESQPGVLEAQTLVDRALSKANEGRTGGAQADYEALTALRAIERPGYNVDTFARSQFNRFSTAAQPIIQNHMLLEQLFTEINRVATHWLNPRNRQSLDDAIGQVNGATGASAKPTSGCVPTITGGMLVCNLVWVNWPDTPPAGGAEIQMRPSRRGRWATKKLYNGESLTSQPEQYLVPVNFGTSRDVLGNSEGAALAEYRRDIAGIRELINQTIEVQGRLQTELGTIVSSGG